MEGRKEERAKGLVGGDGEEGSYYHQPSQRCLRITPDFAENELHPDPLGEPT